jgi:hypothetical protein
MEPPVNDVRPCVFTLSERDAFISIKNCLT